MFQAKVDTRFLGTIQNTFYGLPSLPEPVKIFFISIAIGITLLCINYFIKKYRIIQLVSSLIQAKLKTLFQTLAEKTERFSTKKLKAAKSEKKKSYTATDQDILDKLVMDRATVDISGERSGQRTLAAIANTAGTEGNDIIITFKDVVTESLLAPGSDVKCIFSEFIIGKKKINAFVGVVKSYSKNKGAVITRTSSFGYIRRRVYARRKVADQRFIKIKIWRLEDEDYDIDYILDSSEPDIIIDNRNDINPKSTIPQVLDISKGGIALLGTIREGGNMISRSDRILLCMIIYMPKRKTFQPHLIYAETRGAKAARHGMIRLSFQFLRSLKVPPRKRSTLFKGQAIMAMNLAQSQKAD